MENSARELAGDASYLQKHTQKQTKTHTQTHNTRSTILIIHTGIFFL